MRNGSTAKDVLAFVCEAHPASFRDSSSGKILMMALQSNRLEHAEMLERIWQPVRLCHVATEVEAQLIVSILDQAGIHARALGGYVSGFRAEVPGMVSILVDKLDYQAAQQIYAQQQKLAQQIDWDRIDVGNPEEE